MFNEILLGLKPVIIGIVNDPLFMQAVVGVIIGLLMRAKWLTERDIQYAKDMLSVGKSLTHITDNTRLKLHEAAAVKEHADIKARNAPDTNKKKIQRAARAALRGWLR